MKKIASFLFSALVLGGAARADVLAEYQFIPDSQSNPTSFNADSSGNNHTLGNGSGVASSTTMYDSAGPTADSAYFDGSQTGSATPPASATTFVVPFNFAPYNDLNFNFYLKDTGTSAGTLFAYTFDLNNVTGGFAIAEDPTAGTITVIQKIPNGAGTGYAQDVFDVSSIASFQNYDVNIDNTTTGSSHITLSENGTAITPSSILYQGSDLGTFTASNYLWIGQDDYNNSALTGYLQDVTISGTVPEPSTWALILAGVGALLALGRLCRRSAV